MGWTQWVVYVLSLFLPLFGFVTFWVFSGRDDELKEVGKWSLVASVIGVFVWAVFAALGVTVLGSLWQGLGFFQ